MKIVLLGANGRTGRQVIRVALEAGHSVTALVRSKDKLADISHERLAVRVGDACDPKALAPLLPGQDVVISVLGPRWPTKTATAVYSKSAHAIVEAMQAGAVKRLIVTSSALHFPADSTFVRVLKRLVPNIVAQSGQMEERVCGSDLDWTIARLGFLDNKSDARYRLAVGALPKGGGAVSRAAVARFLVTEAEQADHMREIVGLCR